MEVVKKSGSIPESSLVPFAGVYLGVSQIFSAAMRWQARLYMEGIFSHTLDCAMRYRLPPLLDEATRSGIAHEMLLQSITVQRAFTPYQILDVLQSLRKGLLAINPLQPIFIFAPAKQFFDGDVRNDEAEYLLHRLVYEIQLCRKAGKTLLIFEKNTYNNKLFPGFMTDLLRISDSNRLLVSEDPSETMLELFTSIQKPNQSRFRGKVHGSHTSPLFQAN